MSGESNCPNVACNDESFGQDLWKSSCKTGISRVILHNCTCEVDRKESYILYTFARRCLVFHAAYNVKQTSENCRACDCEQMGVERTVALAWTSRTGSRFAREMRLRNS
jgi:hypothetical protein